MHDIKKLAHISIFSKQDFKNIVLAFHYDCFDDVVHSNSLSSTVIQEKNINLLE